MPIDRSLIDRTPIQIGTLIGDRLIQGGYKEFPRDGESYPKWYYPTGVALWSLCHLTDRSGDNKYLKYAHRCVKYYIKNNKVNIDRGPRDPMDTAGPMGHAIVNIYLRTGDEELLQLSKHIADFLMKEQPRLLDGTFCYWKIPQLRRIWIDPLFMVCPLLANIGKITGERKYYDEAIRQIFSLTTRLQDPLRKLFYQGWGWGINKTTHSPGFWSRGNGWALMAMTEVLETIPENYPKHNMLIKVNQTFINEIVRYQGERGLWHQLVDLPDSFEETSGTAIFTYSIARNILNRWVSKKYSKYADRGVEGLKLKIDEDGNIKGICIGTPTQDTLQDYYSRSTPINDWHGIGPVILAACAVDELNN